MMASSNVLAQVGGSLSPSSQAGDVASQYQPPSQTIQGTGTSERSLMALGSEQYEEQGVFGLEQVEEQAVGYEVVAGGERVAKTYTKSRKQRQSGGDHTTQHPTRVCPYCDSVAFYHHQPRAGDKTPHYTCLTKKIDTCRDCAACVPVLRRCGDDNRICVCPMRDKCTCGKPIRVCALAKCRTCKIACATGDSFSTNAKTLAKFAGKRRAVQEKDATHHATRRAKASPEAHAALDAGDLVLSPVHIAIAHPSIARLADVAVATTSPHNEVSPPQLLSMACSGATDREAGTLEIWKSRTLRKVHALHQANRIGKPMYQCMVNSVLDTTTPKDDLDIILSTFEGDDASLVSVLEARYDLAAAPSQPPSSHVGQSVDHDTDLNAARETKLM